MLDFFEGGGVIMWPLLLLLLAILFLAGRAAFLLGRGGSRDPDVDGTLRAILVWGAMCAVLGLLGTTVGLVQMSEAIVRANRMVAPTTLAGGIGVSLITSIFGLLILLIAALLWFSLRQWHLRGVTRPTLPA